MPVCGGSGLADAFVMCSPVAGKVDDNGILLVLQLLGLRPGSPGYIIGSSALDLGIYYWSSEAGQSGTYYWPPGS